MHRIPTRNWSKNARGVYTLVALALLTFLTGCSNWTYRHLKLGQSPSEYERVLPVVNTAQTPASVCYLRADKADRRESLVLLITIDRRLAGKLHAKYRERKGSLRYELTGRIDPELFGTGAAGTTNTLRAVAVDLMEQRTGQIAAEAHAWVAAGIVRVLEQTPEADDFGVSADTLEDLFDRLPGGGEADVETNEHGVIELKYEVERH